MSRIGVLTGGGDCPGLNAVIRAVVRKGVNAHGHEFVGFRYGWAGVLAGDDGRARPTRPRAGILHRGGTILGTSRTNPYKEDGPGAETRARGAGASTGIDALIPIGGEDTLGVARRLADDGVAVVGVPKTIDNDLAGTDFTFGFQTAVQIATDAIDRLHTTAESHNRVIVVEVMGRHAGWIAVLLRHGRRRRRDPRPRAPVRHRGGLRRACAAATPAGRTFSIVVVSEGATPDGRRASSELGRRPTRSATRASAASPSSSSARSRSAPASRRA